MWIKHIDHSSIKMFNVVGIRFRLISILLSDVQKTLCNSLIMLYSHYCLSTWESTVKKTGHKLYLLQKKDLRLIDNSHYIAHTTFKKCDLEIIYFIINY